MCALKSHLDILLTRLLGGDTSVGSRSSGSEGPTARSGIRCFRRSEEEEEPMVPVSWKIILVTALVSIARICLPSPPGPLSTQTTGKQDNKTAWESYKN